MSETINVKMTEETINVKMTEETINVKMTVGGATQFKELTDTPSTYTGQVGKYAKVNATEDGLEFDSPAGSGDMVKSVYDTDGDGIVDTCNKVDGGVWES